MIPLVTEKGVTLSGLINQSELAILRPSREMGAARRIVLVVYVCATRLQVLRP